MGFCVAASKPPCTASSTPEPNRQSAGRGRRMQASVNSTFHDMFCSLASTPDCEISPYQWTGCFLFACSIVSVITSPVSRLPFALVVRFGPSFAPETGRPDPRSPTRVEPQHAQSGLTGVSPSCRGHDENRSLAKPLPME